MKKILSVPIILSLTTGLLVVALAGVARAYPSRAADCSICHSKASAPQGYVAQLGAAAAVGNATVEQGQTVQLPFEVTQLPVYNDPGYDDAGTNTQGQRVYMTVLGLDQLNVGPAGSAADIPYAPAKYSVNDTWHYYHARGSSLTEYMGPLGRHYAQSTEAIGTFPLDLAVTDAAPGTYDLMLVIAGGKPMDNGTGWYAELPFQLEVTAAGGGAAAVPEPSSMVLLGLGLGAFALFGRRRRERTA